MKEKGFTNETLDNFKSKTQLCDLFDIKLRDHIIDALTIIIKRMNLSSTRKLCSATLKLRLRPLNVKLWFLCFFCFFVLLLLLLLLLSVE